MNPSKEQDLKLFAIHACDCPTSELKHFSMTDECWEAAKNNTSP